MFFNKSLGYQLTATKKINKQIEVILWTKCVKLLKIRYTLLQSFKVYYKLIIKSVYFDFILKKLWLEASYNFLIRKLIY